MLNQVTLMGRLTADPELRHTQSQTAVVSFTLAVERDFKAKDGGDKQTDFINCVAWRSGAEFVSKYFHKGSMAIVSGRLQIRPYEDKQGNKRTAAEVVADNVYFGESRRTDAAPAPTAEPPQFRDLHGYGEGNPFKSIDVQMDINDEDLPF